MSLLNIGGQSVNVDIIFREKVGSAIVELLQVDCSLLLLPDHLLPEVHPVGRQVLPQQGLRPQLHEPLGRSDDII